MHWKARPWQYAPECDVCGLVQPFSATRMWKSLQRAENKLNLKDKDTYAQLNMRADKFMAYSRRRWVTHRSSYTHLKLNSLSNYVEFELHNFCGISVLILLLILVVFRLEWHQSLTCRYMKCLLKAPWPQTVLEFPPYNDANRNINFTLSFFFQHSHKH